MIACYSQTSLVTLYLSCNIKPHSAKAEAIITAAVEDW